MQPSDRSRGALSVLVAAGASGGHVYPGLATAQVLRARGHTVAFAGGDRLEAGVVPAAGFDFHPLPVKRPPSVRAELITPRGLVAVASIARATWLAGRLLKRIRPDVVLGMGGFASVPVAVAAGRRGLPLVLHEQNAHLSLAQKIALRWATVLALGLPIEEGTTHGRVELVGNPIRDALRALPDRADARTRLGLDATAPVVLVMGGSLGSGPLNELVPRIDLSGDAQVLHLAGRGRADAVRAAWATKGANAVVLEYLDDMQDAYAAADVTVSRSGAITVAELAAVGMPAILVPLKTLARGDQDANARVLERAGAAIIVQEDDASFVPTVSQHVASLLTDRAEHARMSAAARSVARPDAAERLADVVERATTVG